MGVEAGSGAGVTVISGVGAAVGVGVTVSSGVGAGVGVGVAVSSGLGAGSGVGVGVGVGLTDWPQLSVREPIRRRKNARKQELRFRSIVKKSFQNAIQATLGNQETPGLFFLSDASASV